MDYKSKKVLPISSVSELTDLSLRQIRYYEERKLISPERTKGGTRKYSFLDVEKLIEISQKVHKGLSTYKIKEEERKSSWEIKQKMWTGQINAQFNKKR